MDKPHHQPRLFLIYSLVILTTVTYLLPVRLARAAPLSGGGYIIKMSTINIVGGSVSNSAVKLRTTVGETAPGEFETTGFRLKSGFQYDLPSEPFSFSLGSDSINLGSLLANTFGNVKTTLTVGGAGIHGYTVKAIENHSLQLGEIKTVIPDTICDPARKCTPNQAAPWTSTAAYGFGYNLSGDDIDTSDFVDPTHFRPFANNELNHTPVTLMGRSGRSKKAVATITFQANTSPTQENGIYENSIQFIAIPSY